MDTQNTPAPLDDDSRPRDQQERAATANLNSNDPAVSATSPAYGDFGKAVPSASAHASQPAASASGRSGSNDNPDEFSELNDREKDAHNAPARPEDQPGHVEQNQDPAAVRAAQGEEDDIQRKAWALDDPRYAGGGTHNTRDEPANANYPAKDE